VSTTAGVLVVGCAVVAACGAPPAPVVTAVIEPPPSPPGTDPLAPEERLLALLTADNPRIEQVALAIAGLGDRQFQREAGRRLVALARSVALSPPPRDLDDPPPEVRWLDESRRDAVAPILAAMSHVGGPEVVAYCFALAEDDSAPWARRRLALGVIHLVVPDDDGAAHERRRRLAARLRPPLSGTSVPPTASFDQARIALWGAARRCQREFQRPVARGNVHLTVRYEADGRSAASAEGDAPPELRACLVDAGSHLQITPPPGESGALRFSFTFLPQ
jgi:hypothetical protein